MTALSLAATTAFRPPRIIDEYLDRTPCSRELFARSATLFPSGITHDSRQLDPYPIYVERAAGPLKWDVDGHEYVDYIGGHGALILGHNDPDVTMAATAQLAKGTHYGASHQLEVEWGEEIRRLVPSAERIRFTNSGTEATLLGLRLARAATGKPRVLRFAGHFHGWHDHATIGHMMPDSTPTIGVLSGIAENVVVVPPGDLERTRHVLETDDGIAAVIIEPTGATFGRVPIAEEFLHALRDLTARHGVVLIFDEVITGFRVSPGGAQGAFGIRPDLTSFAKIAAGGFPGAAIVGRKDLLDPLDYEVTKRRGSEKVRHQGTFNANPVCAAAGAAALRKIGSTDACARANATGAKLREALNAVLEEEGVAWAVYGRFSAFHIFTNPKGREIRPARFDAFACPADELRGNDPATLTALRLALLVEGIDIAGWPGGMISATHDDGCAERTIAGFRSALHSLKKDNVLPA
jgi:glutamate-1-semialdehyde 2,1-aminomutase